MKILKFALLGVGRIGKIHAANMAINPKCSIECIYDIDSSAANKIANLYGGTVALSPEEAISISQCRCCLYMHFDTNAYRVHTVSSKIRKGNFL